MHIVTAGQSIKAMQRLHLNSDYTFEICPERSVQRSFLHPNASSDPSDICTIEKLTGFVIPAACTWRPDTLSYINITNMCTLCCFRY